MKNTENIKSIAYLYFQGKIPFESEKILLDFINKSDDNMILFRQWENEWISGSIVNDEMADRWLILQTRMNSSKFSLSRKKKKKLNVRWISIAASILMIISMSVFLYDRFSEKKDNLYFVSEVPIGQKSKLILPDGTLVWLNGGSTLKYSNSFSEKKRDVFLDGEGYFEVTSKKGVPFTVLTSTYNVIVKGTKFNVCAYNNDMTSLTSLLEGKIEIVYANKLYNVSPGEEICINKDQGTIKTFKSNVVNSNAWIDGKMEYERITFDNLVARLSRSYGVEIIIEDEKIKRNRFRISLRNNESIEQVLDGLQLIKPFEYTINGNIIRIK